MARQGLHGAKRLCTAATALFIFAIPATADARYAQRTLKVGSHGSDVKQLQTYLTKAGIRTGADGQYGRGTAASVKSFERAHALRADGRATPSDQRAIKRDATQAARSAPASGNEQTGSSTGGSGYDGSSEGTEPTSGSSTGSPTGKATISSDGRTAVAPSDAPPEVKAAIAAANKITTKPYRYGGGHGKWEDTGYDCSGSVSYAMHGGGLLSKPLDSTGFESWGKAGKGRWITVYANSGHAYTVIAGLRFDTSSAGAGGESGPRWRNKWRSPSGYVARHPAGF
jgi:Putative peptidoglycan binding domain